MPDKKQKLYESLKRKGLYTKSFDDFSSQFSDTEKINKLYEGLSGKGLYTKSVSDFTEQFFSDVKKKVSSEGLDTGEEISGTPSPVSQDNTDQVTPEQPSPVADPISSNIGLNPVQRTGLGSSLAGAGVNPFDIKPQRKPGTAGLEDAMSAFASAQGQEMANKVNQFSANKPQDQVSIDTENVGNRAGYVGNKLLQGIGTIASGLVDIGLNAGKTQNFGLNPLTTDAAIGEYRKNIAPKVRDYLKDKIGFEVDKGAEATYDNEFITSSISGLAQSAPAMLSGYTGLLLQGFDSGMQSINNSDPDGLLDEQTKTIYASGLGLVQSALEKVGLDKIMQGNTTILSKLLFDKAVREASQKTAGKVTGDVLEQYINNNIKGITGLFAKGGARAVEGFLTEGTTGATQEAAAIGSEFLLNKATGKPIFDTSKEKTWDGFIKRVAYAGAQEGVGGFIMGPFFGGERKAKVKEAQNKVEAITAQLENPKLLPPAAEALTKTKIELQEQIEAEAAKEAEEQKLLPTAALKRATEIDEELNNLEVALSDPELAEELKPEIQSRIDALNAELNQVVSQPKVESKFKKNDLVNYTDEDGNVTQVPVESVNEGKVKIGINKDGIYSSIEVDAEQVSPLNAPVITNVENAPVETHTREQKPAKSEVAPTEPNKPQQNAEGSNTNVAQAKVLPEQAQQASKVENTKKANEEVKDNQQIASKYLSGKWFRGERSENSGDGDRFFSQDESIAGDYGDISELSEIEKPKNPLVIGSKEGLVDKLGYTGDPLAEPLDTPNDQKFDTLAKNYAISLGNDAIIYESGTFDEPELHLFNNAKNQKVIGNPEYKSKPQSPGIKTYIRTPDGDKIHGIYKVVSADDVLASHNEQTFAQTKNFPTTETGTTVNDRDYSKDRNAQGQVIEIASNFDSRAINDTPVVDSNGIVISGNNRTMSRKLSATNKTDATYLEELNDKAEMFGIDPESIKGIQNPMLVFEPKENMPYTTETFAKFNKVTRKEKGPIEKAVEIAKTITDKARRQISSIYENATKASDITSDSKNAKELKNVLIGNKIIDQKELPRYFDVNKNVFTKEGVAFLENLLMGGALNESSLRALDVESMGDIRRKIIGSVVQLTRNSSLDENSLSENISNAIGVANTLKKSGLSLLEYISQGDIFDNKSMSRDDFMVADAMINDKDFKGFLDNYNNTVGVSDIFSGKERTKSDITDNYIDQKYGKQADKIRKNLSSSESGRTSQSRGGNGGIRQESSGTVDVGESQIGNTEPGGTVEAASGLRESLEAVRRKLKGSSRDQIDDSEKRAALDFAKKNNLWVDDFYNLGIETRAGGNENTLILNPERQIVFKKNNLSNNNFSVLDLLDQVELHNKIFPETKYEFVGLTGLEGSKVRTPHIEVVLSQQFVDESTQASPKEIAQLMEARGFTQVNPTTFTNDEYTVSDLHPRNVLKATNGSIHVVDNIIKNNTSEQQKINKQSPNQDAQILSNSINPLPGLIGTLNKAQEKYIATNTRKVEDFISSTFNTWLESKNYFKRNAAQIATAIFNGILRSQSNLTGKLEMTGGMNKARHDAKKLLDQLYNLVNGDLAKLEQVHQMLDPDLYASLGKPPLGSVSADVQMLHDNLRDMLDDIHRRNFALGFIDQETYDKHKGTYTPRMYETNEIPDDVQELLDEQEKFNPVTKMETGQFKKRKDLDDLSQKAKDDLLKDPVYSAVKRLMQLDQNAAIASYVNQIITNSPSLVKDPASGDIPKGYQLLSGKGYGKLDGKYVPNYIAEDFKGFFMLKSWLNKGYDFAKAYDKLSFRQFLKKSYTVFNPVVQLGNFISNFTFAFSAGIDPVTFATNLPKAFKALKSEGTEFQTLLRAGILNSDTIVHDLLPIKAKMGVLPKDQNIFMKALGKIDEKATEAYQMSDDMAKMNAYLIFREQGFTQAQAIQKVYEGFQNYATVGKMWDAASKVPFIGPAFIKFQADLLRIIKNGATKTPLTTAMYLASLNAVPQLLQMAGIADDEEDEDEEALRTSRDFIPKVPLGFTDIPLVYKTKFGEVNLARYLSPFYMFDTGDASSSFNLVKKLLPVGFINKQEAGKGNETISPALADPLAGTLYEAIFGDTDFRGKSIKDPESTRYRASGATEGEQLINKATYIGRSWIPQGANIHDFYLSQKYGEDFYGRTRNTAQSLLNMVVKVQDWKDGDYKKTAIKKVDVGLSQIKSLGDERKNIMANFGQKIQNANQDYYEKRITKEQYDRRIEEFRKKVANRIQGNQESIDKVYSDLNDFVNKNSKFLK